jgi:fucose permease
MSLTVSGLSLALMLVLPDSRHVLWIGSGLLGLAIAPIFPQVLLVADARLHLRGSTTRWFFVSASLGSIVIPTSLGQGFEFVGPQLLMPALLVILLAAVACHLLLLQRLKRPGNKG